MTSGRVNLIWHQGQCAYDIKDSATDMISRVRLIWHQGQWTRYDIKDSAPDMISRTVRLLNQGQCACYIKDSAPNMTSRTVKLIWYQGQCAWYDIESAPDMTSRTVNLIWHQGQCAWYDIKDSHSHFTLPERKGRSCGHSTALYAAPSVFLCTFLFVLHSCVASRKTDLPLYWLSSPKDTSVPFLCHRNQRDSDSVDRVVIRGNNCKFERVSRLELFTKRNSFVDIFL